MKKSALLFYVVVIAFSLFLSAVQIGIGANEQVTENGIDDSPISLPDNTKGAYYNPANFLASGDDRGGGASGSVNDSIVGIKYSELTFVIDESGNIGKSDLEKYRYKIPKFLLNVFSELSTRKNQQVSARHCFSLNWNDCSDFGQAESLVIPPEPSPTDPFETAFEKVLNEKIKKVNPSSGSYQKHQEIIAEFTEERVSSPQIALRALLIFTDGTFFLDKNGNPTGETIKYMDVFTQKIFEFSPENKSVKNEPGQHQPDQIQFDRIVIFLLPGSLSKGLEAYWKGIDLEPNVDVFFMNEQDLEENLSSFFGLMFSNGLTNTATPNIYPSQYYGNSLEGWTLFRSNGNYPCEITLPSLPYNITRSIETIKFLTIDFNGENHSENNPFIGLDQKNKCENNSVDNPAPHTLCKMNGTFFFWWKADDFTIDMVMDNKNVSPICNGTNGINKDGVVLSAILDLPDGVTWDHVRSCFNPTLGVNGNSKDIYSPTEFTSDLVTFFVPKEKIGLTDLSLDYEMFFKEDETTIFNSKPVMIYNYPVWDKNKQLTPAVYDNGEEELKKYIVEIPLNYYVFNADFPAKVNFQGPGCPITYDYPITKGNQASGLFFDVETNKLILSLIPGLRPGMEKCKTMTIYWQPAFWTEVRNNCNDQTIPETKLEFLLTWEKVRNSCLFPTFCKEWALTGIEVK